MLGFELRASHLLVARKVLYHMSACLQLGFFSFLTFLVFSGLESKSDTPSHSGHDHEAANQKPQIPECRKYYSIFL
jgi:hypothetical protein